MLLLLLTSQQRKVGPNPRLNSFEIYNFPGPKSDSRDDKWRREDKNYSHCVCDFAHCHQEALGSVGNCSRCIEVLKKMVGHDSNKVRSTKKIPFFQSSQHFMIDTHKFGVRQVTN